MALDLKKMREKLSVLKNGGSNFKNNWWKPQTGENTIRITPTSDGDPFKEAYLHYSLTKGGVLCPKKNFGEKCSVCEYVSELYDSGEEESIAAARDLVAKRRFFSPVLDRSEDHGSVLWWGYGKKVYEKLLSLVLNPEYGDITDEKDGTDLDITYGKAPGMRFPSTDVTPKRKSSVVTTDKAILEEIAGFDSNVLSLFQRKTSAEVSELLDAYLLGGDAEEGGDESSADEPSRIESTYKEMLEG
tara:strand:+ start:974 stop:1705 length:732 start_codon:yes stop_codon:yes gene_type:complete